MNGALFPSALRELRDNLTNRPVVVGMLALGLILGISGPFDTLRIMSFLPRTLYWVTVVGLTFSTGSLIANMVHRVLRKRAVWVKIAVSSCAIGVAVTIVLGVLNLLVFGVLPNTWAEALSQLGIVTLISAVIETCSFAMRTDALDGVSVAAPLLDRLPFDKRGALVAISAEDHYVRITTTKGTELVLMRLSDAMKEVGSTPGLQIHRSHWVALDQIKNVTRSGDRGEAKLLDGAALPISRGFMPSVRLAGLLPKARNG